MYKLISKELIIMFFLSFPIKEKRRGIQKRMKKMQILRNILLKLKKYDL